MIEWKQREKNYTNSKSQYTPNPTNIPNMDRQHKLHGPKLKINFNKEREYEIIVQGG